MIDYSDKSEDDLWEIEVSLNFEKDRRRTIVDLPQKIAAEIETYQNLTKLGSGEMWKKPSGAHDAYPDQARVTNNNKVWISLMPNNVFEPGVTGWREEVAEGEYAEWIQPLGAHDAYKKDDVVRHEGSYWISNIENNVYPPGSFGWSPFEPTDPTAPTPEDPQLPIDEWPLWVAWDHVGPMYQKDSQVTHAGRRWISSVDNNVWTPGEYGWTDQGPAE